MSRILDFKTKYDEKIISIDPSFSGQGGLGWSIVNKNAEVFGGTKNLPIIHRSGLIKPFSTESNLMTMNELCEKFIDVWRNDAGFSREPLVLVVEQPEIYPNSPVRFSSLTDLSIFAGLLIKALSPKLVLAPTAREWKGTKKKADTQAEIENISDIYSKRALKRDLEKIPLHQRHNVYDAMGLALYGADVEYGKKPLPRLFFRSA